MKTLWIFLLSAVSLTATPDREFSDPRFDREIRTAIEFTLRQEYDSALSMAAQLEKKERSSPAGFFLTVSILSARYYDLNDTSSLKRLYKAGEQVLKLTSSKSTVLQRYYRAATLSFLSVILAKEGNLFKGALFGRRGALLFENLLNDKIVSSDALGILGCYHYWASVVLKGLAWIPFIDDRRTQGIAELENGYQNARYMKFALAHSLLWIYYDNGRFREALALCNRVLKQYPDHPLFQTTRMHILYKLGRFEEAQELGLALKERYKGREEVPVNLTVIQCKLALVYFSMGDRKKGVALARALLNRPYEAPFRQKIKKDLNFVEKALNQVE